MSRENVEIARREYEAFNRTGAPSPEAYAPEFEFHDLEGAPNPVRGGFEEWRQWSHDVHEAFGDFVLEPQELLDYGDHVVAVVSLRGRGSSSGVDLEQIQLPLAVLWTLRDGRIVRGRLFRTRAEAIAAAELR